MKKLLTLFAMLTIFVSMMAQTTPLNYQAVLRDPATNELVRNQAGQYQISVIQNADPIDLCEGEFQTNFDGMVNLPLIASNDIEWIYVDSIRAIFTYGNQEIVIVTPVTAVPYAFHTDGAILTTDHIVDYINSGITGEDIHEIYSALKSNTPLHDGMRDSIVNYIKKNYDKAKEIGYHYLFLITAEDLNRFYQEGRTLDQEVKDSIYSMAKKFLKDNRDMMLEVAKYYAETASAAEVNQLYNELLNNSTASVKIRQLLYGYFDAYLAKKGLNGCNFCEIINSFDPNVTPPALPASAALLNHGITSNGLLGSLKVTNTPLETGDLTLQPQGCNYVFTPTLEVANGANGHANTFYNYRFTIPFEDLLSHFVELHHRTPLTCTLKIKRGQILDTTIVSDFEVDIDCPSPVVENGMFELTLDNHYYTGEFTYTGGSNNVTVTGLWSDELGEHFFNLTDNSPALTIDKNAKKVSVAIPEDSVMLPVAYQMYVTVILKDNTIDCEDTAVNATYELGQFLCPSVNGISVLPGDENPYVLQLAVSLLDYDATKVDTMYFVVSYGEAEAGIQSYYFGVPRTSDNFQQIVDLNDICGNADTTFSIYFKLYGKDDCSNVYSSDIVTYKVWHCGQPIEIAGEEYGTEQFGNLCWMTENMRYIPDGATRIDDGRFNPSPKWEFYTTSNTEAYYYYPQNNADTATKYGFLYNWLAATAGQQIDQELGYIQGICPEGWQLPTFDNIPLYQDYSYFFNGPSKAGMVTASGYTGDFGTISYLLAIGKQGSTYVPSRVSSVVDNGVYNTVTDVARSAAFSVRCVKIME